eukprot:scaffold9512_cov29-Prasinocladus_malaysianus.AAC.1
MNAAHTAEVMYSEPPSASAASQPGQTTESTAPKTAQYAPFSHTTPMKTAPSKRSSAKKPKGILKNGTDRQGEGLLIGCKQCPFIQRLLLNYNQHLINHYHSQVEQGLSDHRQQMKYSAMCRSFVNLRRNKGPQPGRIAAQTGGAQSCAGWAVCHKKGGTRCSHCVRYSPCPSSLF